MLDYERFVRLPERPKPPPTPVVPAHRVGRAPPPKPAQPPVDLDALPPARLHEADDRTAFWLFLILSASSLARASWAAWVVAERCGVTVADLIGSSRKAPIVRARQLAFCAVAMVAPNQGLDWIGERFNRDHASVLHGMRRMGFDYRRRAFRDDAEGFSC